MFFSLAEIVKVLADCGVDTVMLRNMAIQRNEELRSSLGAALSAKLTAGVLAAAVLLGVTFWMSPSTPILNGLVALLALTPLLLNVGANYFIATRQAARVLLPVSVITIGAGGAVVVVSVLSTGVLPVIATVVSYEVALGAWLFREVLRVSNARPVLSLRRARDLVRSSLPLGVALALGFTYGKIDVFVLDHFSDRGVVGQYSFWSRLLDPFLFLSGVVAITAYGHLSSAIHEGDLRKTIRIARRYMVLNLSMSGAVALLFFVAGGSFAALLFPGYANSVWMGRLLGALLVLRSINAILTAGLQAAARRKLIMLISAGNFVVALVASVSLGSVAGALGVLCGLLLMEAINVVVQLACTRRVVLGLAGPGEA